MPRRTQSAAATAAAAATRIVCGIARSLTHPPYISLTTTTATTTRPALYDCGAGLSNVFVRARVCVARDLFSFLNFYENRCYYIRYIRFGFHRCVVVTISPCRRVIVAKRYVRLSRVHGKAFPRTQLVRSCDLTACENYRRRRRRFGRK